MAGRILMIEIDLLRSEYVKSIDTKKGRRKFMSRAKFRKACSFCYSKSAKRIEA